MIIKKISIIGLGKLGLPMMACFASKGFTVLGIDKNKALLTALEKDMAPFHEPSLSELLKTSRGRISLSSDFSRAIGESDASFLIVPTPSKKSGAFSNEYLENALVDLAKALKTSKKSYHLFIISSTVMPGSTAQYFIPLIEKYSGRTFNKGFGVCYNPEFIALGSVIRDFLNPDVLLIGEGSVADGKALAQLYIRIHETLPTVARMSLVSAEITKISLNSYVTMKISFANQLAQICSSVPETDIDAITQAIGGDSRIGTKYLRGGLSYGGPCFPRDNRAFSAFARQYGHTTPLAHATDAVNKLQNENLIKTVLKHHKKGTVLLVGCAYKDNTHVTEESAGLALINALLKKKVAVAVYDPLAAESVRHQCGKAVRIVSSLPQSLPQATTCVVISNTKETRLVIEKASFKKPITIIDCWRSLNLEKTKGPVTHAKVGRHS